ncbi:MULTISPECIES: hypothetical protein [unclassified Kribbella]|uniref:hypothetical protein n=1 Tax=unclassified Kribbella TaxID=2644121 RepID=UPI00301A2E55
MDASDDCFRAGSVDSTIDSGVGETKDHELPLALAYARTHLLMVESEVHRTKERLVYFARLAGFRLGGVYVEEVQTWPAAFEALIHASLIEKPGAIIVPSLFHLAVLGAPTSIKQHIEHLTGAQVLAATDLVSYMPGAAAS